MSTIREVTVRYGRTASIAPYESERVDVELTATVGPDDDALPLTHDLLREAKDGVELHLREFERQRRYAHQQPLREAGLVDETGSIVERDEP